MASKAKALTLIYALVAAPLVATATAPYWATDEQGAVKTLESANLTPTKIGGEYGWFRCGIDIYTTKFEATNIKGQKVSGYVCSNPFFNGSTLDFDKR